MIAMHEGGTIAIVFGPSAARTCRTESASTQPGHAACPEHNMSCSHNSSFRILRRDIDPTHAREITMNSRCVRHPVERRAQLLVQHAAVAWRMVSIEHQDVGNTRERSAQSRDRKGPEQAHLDKTDGLAGVAHRVDSLARRAAHASHRRDDNAGAFAAIAFDHAIAAPGQVSPLVIGHERDLRDLAHRVLDRLAVPTKHVLRDDVAPRLDLRRVEAMLRRVGRQEGIDHLLRRHEHGLERVGDVERVVVHQHRQQDFLGDPERLDHRVERFLRALGVELDPAGVALREAVRLVRPERPWRGHRPVDVHHHDRRPRPARVVEQLVHQQQALRRRCREDANTRKRCRDARRHHRVLGFGCDHLGIETSIGLEFGDLFQNGRLRRDGIDGDDFGSREARRPGDRVVSGEQHPLLTRLGIVASIHRCSSTIFIDPVGHSRTQMPHPLQ
jgi:hypothetical protein